MFVERIKNEAKSIKKMLDKDNNLKYYNKVENIGLFFGFSSSFIMISILSYFYFNSNDAFINFIGFLIVFFILGSFLTLIKSAFLEIFFEIYKNKILKLKEKDKVYNKVFSYKYYVNKKELIEYKNLYKSLSKNAKLVLEDVTGITTQISEKDIEKHIFEKEIIEQPLSYFIDYIQKEFESDVKEIPINKSKLIESKLNHELKNINKEDFLKYKNDIIYLSGKINNNAVELNILRKIEELKFKYDNVVINEEIEKIKKNVQYKKDNKILKSI